MADTSTYFPLGCFDSNGGAGLTRDEAYHAALGEALERYCCSVYFKDDLVFGSYREVAASRRALRPGELALFHESQAAQVRYTAFDEDTRLCWTRGYSLSRQEPVLVPACLVYIPYYPFFREQGEVTVSPSISTGQATGQSYEDAVLRGLYEVVERDAFVIMWLNRLPAPRLSIRSSPRVDAIFRERFARPHLEYTLFQMPTDVDIPAVFCLLVDRSRRPPLICSGGAAHLDPERAALKALVEAAQTHQWARFLGRRTEPVVLEPDYSNVDDFEKHVFLYAYGGMEEAVGFLLASPTEKALADLAPAVDDRDQSALQRALARVNACGLEVLAVDLTTEDVARCGYRVVKVIVPGAQQLEGDHTHRFLGGERLYRVPARLGYVGAARPEDLNPDPHPYP
jgi:ribosomal protein S12 methylthiotransferase accessory factor